MIKTHVCSSGPRSADHEPRATPARSSGPQTPSHEPPTPAPAVRRPRATMITAPRDASRAPASSSSSSRCCQLVRLVCHSHFPPSSGNRPTALVRPFLVLVPTSGLNSATGHHRPQTQELVHPANQPSKLVPTGITAQSTGPTVQQDQQSHRTNNCPKHSTQPRNDTFPWSLRIHCNLIDDSHPRGPVICRSRRLGHTSQHAPPRQHSFTRSR